MKDNDEYTPTARLRYVWRLNRQLKDDEDDSWGAGYNHGLMKAANKLDALLHTKSTGGKL